MIGWKCIRKNMARGEVGKQSKEGEAEDKFCLVEKREGFREVEGEREEEAGGRGESVERTGRVCLAVRHLINVHTEVFVFYVITYHTSGGSCCVVVGVLPVVVVLI